ncbi:MAG TPA: translation initiation factor IF-3 [Lacipirellulaceae bacterium]|nr:translation initiation factor IF-3 [Lacipirellulaceae bacterium]
MRPRSEDFSHGPECQGNSGRNSAPCIPNPASSTPGVRAIALAQKGQRINEQIRVSPIRVIAQDGALLGVIETVEALQKAREVGMDLVEVAPQEKPPVCRIMDFGKFKYQQKKRQHKGHTHHGKNKELRLRPKIGDHDLMTKVNRAKEFLADKDKVVFSVIFRGRENAHVDEGFKLVQRLTKELESVAKLEQNPSMQGRRIVVIFAPK